jgi:hypothetical protein
MKKNIHLVTLYCTFKLNQSMRFTYIFVFQIFGVELLKGSELGKYTGSSHMVRLSSLIVLFYLDGKRFVRTRNLGIF